MFGKIFKVTLTVTLGFLVSAEAAAKPTNWLIYWYVCGTDIETARIQFSNGTDLMSGNIGLAEPDRRPGDATRCIKEVEKAELSPDVRIFMQAGGTYIWGHPKFRDNNAKIDTNAVTYKKNPDGTYSPISDTVFASSAVKVPQWSLRQKERSNKVIAQPAANGKLSRYVYDKYHRNWFPREQMQISGKANTETDMGSSAGLISFLKSGQQLERELYPDGNVRRVFIFVDHGGGSLHGVCSDEYTKNMLSLKEVRDSFAAVKDGWTNSEEKPFEVVAFDACVMSTYETAVAVEDVANHMVASQESMHGKVMFGYTDLLNELSKNTSMSGKDFGKAICDTYWKDSKVTDKEFNFNTNVAVTMSVIDLSKSKMDTLKETVDNFNNEALNVARQNPEEFVQTFTKFKNAANVSENFSIFYSSKDAVDLKNFAKNVGDNFTDLKQSGYALAKSIDKSVVYQKRGSVFKRGGGISAYYPFDFKSAKGDIAKYKKLAADNLASANQTQLYDFLVKTADSKSSSINLKALANETVRVDEDKKTVRLEVDADKIKNIGNIFCQMVRVSFNTEEDGTKKPRMLFLGGDSGIAANWETGEFESAFKGKWITLDGQPVFNQIVSDGTVKNKRGKKVGGVEVRLIPILLNGESYKMYVTCEYPSEKFTIIGVLKNLDGEVTLPNGDMQSLKKGDVIYPTYIYINVPSNEGAIFTVKDGKVTEVKHIDDFETLED